MQCKDILKYVFICALNFYRGLYESEGIEELLVDAALS